MSNSDHTPLILDVDGTLLRTDLVYETFWAAISRNIWRAIWMCLSGWRHPARLKRDLLTIATPDVALLPVRQEIFERALAAKKAGHPVHLASGSDQTLVDAVAGFLGLEGTHFGSGPDVNLTRSAKALLLVDRFGEEGFDYAGNASDDLETWTAARRIIAVSPGPALTARLSSLDKPTEIVADTWTSNDFIRELRPHHWIKNILVFLPLLAAHRVELAPFLTLAFTFLAFSLAASSTYILNDLLDLDADRRHPEKRNRPIASGILPIRIAMLTSLGLVVAALSFGYLIAPGVAAMILGYIATTLVYSLWLKHLRWLDVMALACLFMIRVLTGAVASQTEISGWLLGFVFSVFLSLAVAKRFTGLSRAFRGKTLPGRGYGQSDARPLRYVAYTSIFAAAVQFLIYTASVEAGALYASTGILALLVVPTVFWLVRMIWLSETGQEDYDQIVFIARDWPGLLLAGLGMAIVLLAI